MFYRFGRKNWTFGVPNDVFFCPLDPRSSLIVGTIEWGGEGIHRRAAELSFLRSSARTSVGADERGLDHGFRAPGPAPTPAGRVFTPLRSLARQFQEHTPRKANRRRRARKLRSVFCHHPPTHNTHLTQHTGELHTAAWPRLSGTARWAQRRGGAVVCQGRPAVPPQCGVF